MHTAANGPGEIRGQVAVTASVTTALNARQEVPKPEGSANRARGTFTATVTKASATRGSMRWRLTFSKLTGRAVAAHVHIGASGKGRPCSRSTLWAVPEWCAQDCDAAELRPRSSRGRARVREHSYATQPGRGDPRSDPRRAAEHLVSRTARGRRTTDGSAAFRATSVEDDCPLQLVRLPWR